MAGGDASASRDALARAVAAAKAAARPRVASVFAIERPAPVARQAN